MDHVHDEILAQLQALSRQIELLDTREVEAIREVGDRFEALLSLSDDLIVFLEQEVQLEEAAERAATLLENKADPRAPQVAQSIREFGQIPRRARANALRRRFPYLDSALVEGPPEPVLRVLLDLREDRGAE